MLTVEEKHELSNLESMMSDLFTKMNCELCSKCNNSHWKDIAKNTKSKVFNGCCSDCAVNNGYHYHYEPGWKFPEKFNKTFGYFDNINKKCKLNPEEKSLMCLGFVCPNGQNYLMEQYGRKILDFMDDLKHKIRKLRYKLNTKE
jgi:hypothetical protein